MKLGKLWEEIPFPESGNKKELIGWVISTQQRSVLRWEAAFVSVVVTFITYVVTGKLVWGVP